MGGLMDERMDGWTDFASGDQYGDWGTCFKSWEPEKLFGLLGTAGPHSSSPAALGGKLAHPDHCSIIW